MFHVAISEIFTRGVSGLAMNYLLLHLDPFPKTTTTTILHQETPATPAYAVHVPPAMTLEVASPGAKIAKHHFSGKKPMVKHLPSDFLVLFSSLTMFLRFVASDVFPPQKKPRLTPRFIVVRPQEATDGILGFKDGWTAPHVICLVVAGW